MKFSRPPKYVRLFAYDAIQAFRSIEQRLKLTIGLLILQNLEDRKDKQIIMFAVLILGVRRRFANTRKLQNQTHAKAAKGRSRRNKLVTEGESRRATQGLR